MVFTRSLGKEAGRQSTLLCGLSSNKRRHEEVTHESTGITWFINMDFKSGYWQVEIDPRDKEKTAFSTGKCL